MIKIKIVAPDPVESALVEVSMTGGYNPDMLDDMTRRAIAVYQECFAEMTEAVVDGLKRMAQREAEETE